MKNTYTLTPQQAAFVEANQIVISVHYDPKPIPVFDYDYLATDSNTYDGADDSLCHQVGAGATEQKAVDDLLMILEEYAE